MMATAHQGLCLLSLKCGSVRGLSTLQNIQQLMERINPEYPPKPCEYFDMIGGTSTGGLIAIMLGRLRMDAKSCIKAYTDMSGKIFRKKCHRVKKVKADTNVRDLRSVGQILREVLIGKSHGPGKK